MSTEYNDVKLHINGTWRDAIAGETLDIINPATENIIGSVAHARSSDLDEALEAASGAFKQKEFESRKGGGGKGGNTKGIK